jgi:ABC-type transport system involved in Fe-S cluster assembly fused permease/ATPase subunit
VWLQIAQFNDESPMHGFTEGVDFQNYDLWSTHITLVEIAVFLFLWITTEMYLTKKRERNSINDRSVDPKEIHLKLISPAG